jgi:hypothetical protein
MRDFYGGEYEEYCLLGCDTVWFGRKVPASQWNCYLCLEDRRVPKDGGNRCP